MPEFGFCTRVQGDGAAARAWCRTVVVVVGEKREVVAHVGLVSGAARPSRGLVPARRARVAALLLVVVVLLLPRARRLFRFRRL